jgi:toxin ParE1/3/4
MSRRVSKSAKARRDLIGHYVYLAERSPDAAERFFDATEKTLRTLLSSPLIGTMCPLSKPQLAGLRQWRIEGFENYLIFYLPAKTGIKVVRVLHAARDWMKILES